MQNNVLSEEQKQLLPLLKDFSKQFGLIGGTAIALQIGHRRSIDFDLASIDILTIQRLKTRLRGLTVLLSMKRGIYNSD
jgi:hypothetical protein